MASPSPVFASRTARAVSCSSSLVRPSRRRRRKRAPSRPAVSSSARARRVARSWIAGHSFTPPRTRQTRGTQGEKGRVLGYPDVSSRAMPKAKADAKVIVVMPAHNAARTLEKTLSAIPRDWVDELILVDDPSTDDTAALARRVPSLHVVWHPHTVGYGGNQKTCFLEALQRGADVVVMLHPDGQYEPLLIPKLVAPILEDRADLVLGSRFL